MGFSSQAGRTIVRTQAVAGTYQADTGTAGLTAKLTGGAFSANRELLVTDPEIGGGRDVTDALMGAVSYTADYAGYLRPDIFSVFAGACLGDIGLTPDTPVASSSTVDIATIDSATLPFLSFEESVGGTGGSEFDCFNYFDGVVNTLGLEVDANGYAKFTAAVVAKRGVAGATPTDEDDIIQDASCLIVGTNVSLSYNSVPLPAKSFSLDINNNFETDDHRLGSFYLGDLTGKRREIMSKFKIRESSHALWRQATYGADTATTPQGTVTKAPLVVTLTGYTFVTGSTPYSITITLPNFAIKPYKLNVSGDAILDSDLEGQALRPDVLTPAISMSIVTGLAALP